jgi:CRISPR-associated protein Cas1
MATLTESAATLSQEPDLIPARMLNEFAYCPRLAYLEWIQGEFTDNLETLEGTFGHRRVDQPTRQEIADPAAAGATAAVRDNEPIHARSLLLSAPGEGLIARLDLLELEGSTATPVDYKRGRVPDLPEGAWEPERVQLCAQGLILREAGFHSEQGELYYIESRRRVVIPFDEALIARTRELVGQLRATAAAGQLPPPLVDSPKCPRCSLVGICLPDETNLLMHLEVHEAAPDEAELPDDVPEAPTIRRLIPTRADALPLYVQEQGATLGKSGEQLTIKQRQEVLHTVRLLDVSQVSLYGNVQVTAQALREIAARGIPICHFSYGGWFHALTTGLVHKNVELRIAQFQTAADPARSLDFARSFIVGKIKNARTLLRRHAADPDRLVIEQLADSCRKAGCADSAESLLGLEGMAAKLYFGGFAKLLKGGEAFDITGRNRRPPRDPVNALLSFVYGLLVKELTIVLHAVGFDPHCGFFHRPRYGRPSLALDLAEEFRPLIADSVVLMLVNNGEVAADSFLRRGPAVALTDAGRRAVLASFERRMETLVTHPLFGYRISYRRLLEVQSRLLARTLLGEIREYPNFCTR